MPFDPIKDLEVCTHCRGSAAIHLKTQCRTHRGGTTDVETDCTTCKGQRLFCNVCKNRGLVMSGGLEIACGCEFHRDERERELLNREPAPEDYADVPPILTMPLRVPLGEALQSSQS